MMMMSGRSSRHPFTEAQWQQLEHQALFFKFMVSGLPIPPDLIFSIHGKTSFPTQPHHIGWTCFQLGLSNKIDPEPTRCRRTDGKKWRCSRQAFGDSKYCERHMHRGKSRPRKPLDSKPFPCSKSSSMAESRTQQSGATHSPLTSSETTQDSTFMTFLGIESGWSPPKQQRTMYQFIEESPQDKRDSWLNLVI